MTEDFQPPNFKGFIDGWDSMGTIISQKGPYKNDNGLKMMKYLILPAESLFLFYPELSQPGFLNIPTKYGNCIWREYPLVWVMDPNTSKTNSMVRVDCGFMGEEGTPYTERDKNMKRRLMELEAENENLRITNMCLHDEIDLEMKTSIEKAKSLNELYKTLKGERNEQEQYNPPPPMG